MSVNNASNQKLNNNRHLIDILFVLSLFCIFAVSSVILILFGANIYQKIVSQMDSNYGTRTSIAYITEKIRQSDTYNSTYITEKNGQEMLVMTQTIDNIVYATSLYEYDGYLYELFSRADIDLPIDAGQPVIKLNNLDFEKISDKLLKISFTDTSVADDNPETTTIYVGLHCTSS